MRKLVFLCIVVITLALVGCYQNRTENINPQPENADNKTTLTKIKEEGRYVYYDGTITVSGKYQEYGPENLLGGELCFYADEKTGYLIPRDPNLWGENNGDTRSPWFCFEDQNEAKEMFDINDEEIFSDKTTKCVQGKATIEISNYIVNKLQAAVFDTANLDKIISKEKYTTQCE